MIEINKRGNLTEVHSTEGYIHKIGDENYAPITRRMLLPNQSVDEFEEIFELPKYTKEDYKEKVIQLIRKKYSDNKEYQIQREALNLLLNPNSINSLEEAPKELIQFNEYNTFVEDCKNQARIILENG